MTGGPFEMIAGDDSLECVDGVCLVPEPATDAAPDAAPGPSATDAAPDDAA